eukprot:8987940-Pyramimonas_sp.AAC.1
MEADKVREPTGLDIQELLEPGARLHGTPQDRLRPRPFGPHSSQGPRHVFRERMSPALFQNAQDLPGRRLNAPPALPPPPPR